MRSLFLNIILLSFLPLKAQTIYVCQDTISHELMMANDDTIFYQSEDRRIAFGLNHVYNTEQVDSVVFSKPDHLKNMKMGWIETGCDSILLFRTVPIREMDMVSSEYWVYGKTGHTTDSVVYLIRFNSKAAAKTFANKYKKLASDKMFPLYTFRHDQSDQSEGLNENDNNNDNEDDIVYSNDFEWSKDSCELRLLLQEQFKDVSIDDTRRVLFYWQNYDEYSVDPASSLLPREPVFGTITQTEGKYSYTYYSETVNATCKIRIIESSINKNKFCGIDLTIILVNDEDAVTYYDNILAKAVPGLYGRDRNVIMITLSFPKQLSFEEMMEKIVRFDMEWNRPKPKPIVYVSTYETVAENYVRISNELAINNATIDAFINQHLDCLDSLCVDTRLGVSKAMKLYLNPSDQTSLIELGIKVDAQEGQMISLYDDELPTSIADSLWSRMTRQIDVQPIYDEYFLFNKMQTLSNVIFNGSQFEQVNVDESFGIPYNSYISVRPVSPTRQDGVCIDLKTVMLPRTYEVEVTFAPDVVEHTDTLPCRVRFMFFHNKDGKTGMKGNEEPSYVINEKDNSKNFVVDDNKDECVTVRFDWTAPAMLNTVYFEVDSHVTTTLQRTYQKDFRLAKVSLRPKNTR